MWRCRCRGVDAEMYMCMYTHVYIYMYGSPRPIDPYFWPPKPTQAGFPQHLMRNQVSGFRDTLLLSAVPGVGPP